MDWETYQNTDFYKESHPNWDEKESSEIKIENEMRRYLASLDDYRKQVEEEIERQENENEDGEAEECLYDGVLPKDADNEERIVRYITTKLWNGRFRGILKVGSYQECLYARYQYNVECIDSEWDWAGIERVEVKNQDELDEVIEGYMDAAAEIEIYGDYDYEY